MEKRKNESSQPREFIYYVFNELTPSFCIRFFISFIYIFSGDEACNYSTSFELLLSSKKFSIQLESNAQNKDNNED